MLKLNVELGSSSYPIYIHSDFESIVDCIRRKNTCKTIVIITDSNVDICYSSKVISILKLKGYDVLKYIIDDGENSKNLDTVKEIYKYLISVKTDRDTILIALGGGMVGDVTGFVAATFLRGIEYIHVPTSLLAQVDSSVGGKVGVNFDGIKNAIGAFYQPLLVYINVNTLKTLPTTELKSGLAEVMCHAAIKDRSLFEFVDSNISNIFRCEEDVLTQMVAVNCAIKAKVVEEDEKEKGLRAILNFGHTIGHAIEGSYEYSMLHGECVSIGMVGAFKLANYMGLVEKNEMDLFVGTLRKIGLPISFDGMDINKVYKHMFYDKKVKNNKLNLVLPKVIGEVSMIPIDNEILIKKVLRELSYPC